MALVLPDERIEPGREVVGELRLYGGPEPVVIDHLRTRLWARVYALFDDDDGAPHVRLFDGTVAEDLHLDAGAEVRTEVRLSIPWSAPVTRSNGARLQGLSVMVNVRGDGAAPVDGGVHWVEVDPLPWQQDLLTACERSGLRWDTTLASPGEQSIRSRPLRKGIRSEVSLGWRVHREGASVSLHGHPRRPLRLRLTHEEAARVDWAGRLARWLSTPAPPDRSPGRR